MQESATKQSSRPKDGMGETSPVGPTDGGSPMIGVSPPINENTVNSQLGTTEAVNDVEIEENHSTYMEVATPNGTKADVENSDVGPRC